MFQCEEPERQTCVKMTTKSTKCIISRCDCFYKHLNHLMHFLPGSRCIYSCAQHLDNQIQYCFLQLSSCHSHGFREEIRQKMRAIFPLRLRRQDPPSLSFPFTSDFKMAVFRGFRLWRPNGDLLRTLPCLEFVMFILVGGLECGRHVVVKVYFHNTIYQLYMH